MTTERQTEFLTLDSVSQQDVAIHFSGRQGYHFYVLRGKTGPIVRLFAPDGSRVPMSFKTVAHPDLVVGIRTKYLANLYRELPEHGPDAIVFQSSFQRDLSDFYYNLTGDTLRSKVAASNYRYRETPTPSTEIEYLYYEHTPLVVVSLTQYGGGLLRSPKNADNGWDRTDYSTKIGFAEHIRLNEPGAKIPTVAELFEKYKDHIDVTLSK